MTNLSGVTHSVAYLFKLSLFKEMCKNNVCGGQIQFFKCIVVISDCVSTYHFY